jgi:NADH-quinone oxidoreductase subunit J
MTTGPKLRVGQSLLPGVLAVALFGAMALIAFNTGFSDEMTGYPEGISVTAELGYAMFDFTALQSTEGNVGATEQFLAAVFLIAVVLDAALDAALVLAKRETDGKPTSALTSVTSGTPGTMSSDQVAAADGGAFERRGSTHSTERTADETNDDGERAEESGGDGQ